MNLIERIAQLTDLSIEAREYISAHVETFHFKKGEEVLREGRSCNYLYFLNKGMMRSYYLIENKEVTNWMATENDFGTSYYSFISRSASYETLECLENTEVQAISYQLLHKVYQLFPETEKAGRLILEDYYLRLEERMLSIQFKTAKERYSLLAKKRPELIRRAPLGCIASYLGMTQETLSRIRAEF